MSELEIETTGNLVLTPVGFTCQAMSCLYSPLPFVTGKRIRVTAGNDLVGRDRLDGEPADGSVSPAAPDTSS